ncbi:MAG: PorT family protein [Bacteroidales bacterium]|nr:PorT family protein [Bacteroidales bacterium]
MRRIIFLLLVIINTTVFAQRFQGGFMAGIAGSQVDGDSYAGYNKINGQGGAYVKTIFPNDLGAQMEIKYCGKGAREKQDEPDPFFYKLSLHYLEVPLLVNYYITDDIFPELGIAPSLLMSKSREDEHGAVPASEMGTYKSFDLGSIIGINYQFSDKWIVNMRYYYSLIPIGDRADNDYYYNFFAKMLGYDQGSYNNVLSFSVYYILSSK